MSNLSICLRLKVSIKSSVLGKHWRALNFKTENYKTLYFFVTVTLSKSYITYKKIVKYIACDTSNHCEYYTTYILFFIEALRDFM